VVSTRLQPTTRQLASQQRAVPRSAFRGSLALWVGGIRYGCFTSGTKFKTSQGSDRTNGWLYANSSDGKYR